MALAYNEVMTLNSPNAFSGLEHLATAVILLNQKQQVIYANPGAEIVFGFSANQVKDLPISQVFPESEVLQEALTHAVKNNSPFREHEFHIKTIRQNTLAVVFYCVSECFLQDFRIRKNLRDR